MELLMHLANGAEVKLNEFTLPMHGVAVYADMAALTNVYAQLTGVNLSQVSISQDGETIQKLTNASLESMQVVTNGDGTITAHFYFNATTENVHDADYVQAAKILPGEEE